MSMGGERLLVTEGEAAKLLRLSVRTLYALRKKGELEWIEVGRAVRYRLQELVVWIERKGQHGQRQ